VTVKPLTTTLPCEAQFSFQLLAHHVPHEFLVSARSKNDGGSWARHKEHLRGISRKETVLTERCRQHLKDCITQL